MVKWLGVFLLGSMLILQGCSGTPKRIFVEKTTYVTPDEWMISPTEEPKLQGDTNRDLIFYVYDLRYSLAVCNADKEAIRYWKERIEELNEESPD